MFYRILLNIICFFFKIIYNPKIINSNVIPKNGAVILAGNHTNNLDCLMIFLSTKRSVHFLGKKELFDSPLGFIYQKLGVISVDRTIKDFSARKSTIDILNKNEVVAIFPEGTINRTENIIMPFKYGAVSFSSKTNTIIIPFSITGNYKFRSKNLKLEFDNSLEITNNLEKYNELLQNKIIDLLIKNKFRGGKYEKTNS